MQLSSSVIIMIDAQKVQNLYLSVICLIQYSHTWAMVWSGHGLIFTQRSLFLQLFHHPTSTSWPLFKARKNGKNINPCISKCSEYVETEDRRVISFRVIGDNENFDILF